MEVPVPTTGLKGDQVAIFERQGPPDAVIAMPWGILRWVYCHPAADPFFVDFDSQGNVMTLASGRNSRICVENHGK